jgi:AraC family transcriptional regulator, regulatory protein of adaptative response / DNA-3-methyladenine glycosylase II
MQARDRRFDGVFYVAVQSTGIYCRPICRVRIPMQRNCRFYALAAQAEQAGFRPCLKCRPERAPGAANIELSQSLAHAALAMLMQSGVSLHAVCARLGISARHLRRLFVREFALAPVQFLQTQRLLLAKQLLCDTALPVSEVAHASGFLSARRLYTLFAQRYRLSPQALRKHQAPVLRHEPELCLRLDFRPPFDWARVLQFFAARALPGIEHIELDPPSYRRSVRIPKDQSHVEGWLVLTPEPGHSSVQLRIASSLAPVLAVVLQRVRRVFDLDAEPQVIAAGLASAFAAAPQPIRTALQALPTPRLPGAFDAFELSVRAVLGQQITVAAARTLALRLVQRFGDSLGTNIVHAAPPKLTHHFPSAERLARASAEELGELGIIGQRARAILALAQWHSEGQWPDTLDPHALCARLRQLPGIGPWTAHYIAMRTLSWSDAWPEGDIVMLNRLGLPNTRAGRTLAQTWAQAAQPWRSYALLALWQCSDTQLNTPTSRRAPTKKATS